MGRTQRARTIITAAKPSPAAIHRPVREQSFRDREGVGVFRALIFMLFFYVVLGSLGWAAWYAWKLWHTH